MGMHGWKHVNRAIQAADLLIAIGMRFDDRVTGSVRTYAPYARIIHADIDPAEIGKNVAVEVPIVGDARHVLAGLMPDGLRGGPGGSRRVSRPARGMASRVGGLSRGTGRAPGATACCRPTSWCSGSASSPTTSATYVADVGQNQMWLARYTKFRRPHSHLSSGGLGTMGYSVPAAMGAALGNPDAETWAVTGDGGFQMTSQELMTLAADRIPVKIAVLDNKKLGMIRQWQEIVYAGNYHSAHLPGPDFVKLADAYGIPAFKATHDRRCGPDDQGRAGRRRPRVDLVRDRARSRTCSR